MTDLLEFLSSLLEGMGLIALALSLGGVGFAFFVLRGATTSSLLLHDALTQSIQVATIAAGSLAGLRALHLLIKPLALVDVMGSAAFQNFFHTQVFVYGLASAICAGGLAVGLSWLLRDLRKTRRWGVVGLWSLLFLVNEAWRSHAASRLEDRELLMLVTMLHVTGATIWAGGVAHLLLAWRFLRRLSRTSREWGQLVSQFSPLGVVTVGFVVGSGLYLSWTYVGKWEGLWGTGYGNLLLVKLVLFGCVLLLAALNFRAGLLWRHRNALAARLLSRVPVYLEVECMLAMVLLFTAAALTGFPPSVDVTEATVTPSEMWRMFAPKLPRLAGPEPILVAAPELTDPSTGLLGQKEDLSWDRFNHNVSGIIVLAIAGIAWLDWLGKFSWARYWPFLFVGFSLLIFVFANPDHWPYGSIGFIRSLQDAEVVQHWLAAVVVFGLGWFEWKARSHREKNPMLPFVFPILCLVGGMILLTHSHNITELKPEFLIQGTHVAMGLLGVLVGCSRWLELRLSSPHNRIAGFLAISGMMLVGWILVFYVNPNAS
ncbi:MAG: hypothetical protein D6704_01460 [Nitrospirae bacterium]|nr:MAG: hypothetical protein D6704_01460 [Nitrospirota bacterium]